MVSPDSGGSVTTSSQSRQNRSCPFTLGGLIGRLVRPSLTWTRPSSRLSLRKLPGDSIQKVAGSSSFTVTVTLPRAGSAVYSMAPRRVCVSRVVRSMASSSWAASTATVWAVAQVAAVNVISRTSGVRSASTSTAGWALRTVRVTGLVGSVARTTG